MKSASHNPPTDDKTQKVADQAESLHVSETPIDGVSLNVEGRQTQSPDEGFGQLWRKTYTIPLSGRDLTPAQVVSIWKEHLPDFQPPENRVFTSRIGVEMGEIILINATTPGGPIGTGMLVMQADDVSFTLMTPEGHPEAGWVKFSAYTLDKTTFAQILTVARSSDPIFEIGFRLFGAQMQENIWHHVLKALASHFNVTGDVTLEKVCLDTHLQWSRIGNIRHNAQLHTLAYLTTAPIQKLLKRNH